MSKTIPILVDGKIPANTECPYTQKCDPNKEFCGHKGVEHSVSYSCGFARAFVIFNR
jgi:ribosomal protein L32